MTWQGRRDTGKDPGQGNGWDDMGDPEEAPAPVVGDFDVDRARRRIRGQSLLSGKELRAAIMRLVTDLRPVAQAYLDTHPQLTPAEHDAHIRDQVVRPAISAFNQRAARVAGDQLPATTVGEVFGRLRGLGPLDALMADPTTTEIMINGPDTPAYVERAGQLVQVEPEVTLTEAEILLALERMQAGVGQPLGEGNPMVEVRLPHARVTAVHQRLALHGPCLTIRKRSKDPLAGEDLVRLGMVSPQVWAFLSACLRGGANMVIAGDFGSGKTTLAQALLTALPHEMRIITVEDPIEFALTHPHVVQLEVSHANLAGQGAITARSLVRLCMRLRPTYLVVGEARDEAAWDMIAAMSLGPAGSLTTTHADSPRGALKRLEHLCLWAADGPPLVAVRSTLAETIHLIVIVRRQTDPARAGGGVRRVVAAVAEVRGLEGDVYQVEDLLEWRDGALCPTGYGPSERLLSRAESHGVAISDLGGRGTFKGGRASGGERTPW